jgi:transcriptional regulator with XRE-family HTH domain
VRVREAIAAEFNRRRSSNPRYSLRAFARAMGVNHATLSRLLSGLRPIQARTIQVLARPMRWSDSQVMAMIAAEDAAAVIHAVAKPSFRPDSRWIASVSGISIDRVNVALQDLLRTRRLRMPAANQWLVTHRRGFHQ